MNFVCYSDWNQLPDSANKLFDEYERQSLFLSRIWFENISKYSLAEDHCLVLACVINEEELLAILPMKQCLQGSLTSLSSNFTSYYSLLITNNNQQEYVVKCLAKGLSQLPVKPIHFEPIDPQDTHIHALLKQLQELGFKSHSYFRFNNWVHQTDTQTFCDYFESRPSHLKNTVQRKIRKLAREQKYSFRIFTDSEIDLATSDYQAVYKNSWKANEFYSEFTPNLIRHASQQGWLRLGVLYIGSQAIAAQIWLVAHKKASIYRLVYDESWKQYSPGSLLTEYLMRYVIDTDKVIEIDFLTGNERYKQDWMTQPKKRIGIRLAKTTKPKSIVSSTLNVLLKNKLNFLAHL